MTRLIVATDRWRPDGGGRERYLDELVSHLSARGRRVSVLCGSPAAAGAFADCSVRRGVRPLRDLRLRVAVRQGRAADPALQVLALSPIAGATHYQLHDGVFERAFAAEREVMASRLGRAMFPMGLALNRHRRRLMHDQRLVVAQALGVMAFSRSAARDVVEHFGVAPARVVVEPPGIDLSRFRPRGVDCGMDARAGELRLAFVGHNFPLKGLQTAIEAVGQLWRDGVEASLTVAGAGRTGRYRRLAERIGVAARVRFAGAIGPDAIAALYRSSDLLVHPTFYDPFPRVVVEALACGCPVITTARCGASEILVHGDNGFCVDDPRDSATIARHAAQLVEPARLAAMRRSAVRTATRLDAALHFDRVIEWLESTPADRAA